jgi:hypothetical protein
LQQFGSKRATQPWQLVITKYNRSIVGCVGI